jgi:hypothetical protein
LPKSNFLRWGRRSGTDAVAYGVLSVFGHLAEEGSASLLVPDEEHGHRVIPPLFIQMSVPPKPWLPGV